MYGSMSCKEAAIEAVKASAQARMAADLTKVPKGPLREFFRFMIANIFVAGMTIEKAKEETGFHDNSVSTRFKPYLRKTLGKYIRDLRMEVANRLLRNLELDVGETGEAIGMNALTSFSSAFLSWSGVRPSTVIGKKLPPEAGDPADADLGPPPSMLEGPQWERWRAEDLWRQMRHRPLEKQRSAVGWHLFHTPALFDLLRRKSRQEGRRDREFGIHLAELALLSLRRCEEGWSEKGYDLRARGFTELANARRLASDLPAANAEIETAWAEWRAPRKSPDPLVRAEIRLHEGTLRISQRRYEEAVVLFDEALPVFEAEGDTQGQIETLIQRAAANGYLERLEEETSDLEEAWSLIDVAKDDFLNLNIKFNLAAAQIRRGNLKAAIDGHEQLESIYRLLAYPKGEWEIQHLEGNISEAMGKYALAEKRYARAYEELVGLEEWRGAAFAGLDLAVVYSRGDRQPEVLQLLSTLIPILESLELYPETLAAVGLLRKALQETDVTHALLCQVREVLRQDPLLRLS